jgi:hypothetical protein
MMDERTKAMLERLVREQPKEAAERLRQLVEWFLAKRNEARSASYGVGYSVSYAEAGVQDDLHLWLKRLDRLSRCAAIVNALIPPVELPAEMFIERAEWADVEGAVREGVPHYIRHGGTAKLLGVPPNDGIYSPKRGDVYLVVRLKPGTAPRGAEVEAGVEDLEVLRVEVKRPPDSAAVSLGTWEVRR